MFSRVGRFFKAIFNAILGEAEAQVPVAMLEESVREIGADEPGAPRDQDRHTVSPRAESSALASSARSVAACPSSQPASSARPFSSVIRGA